ncbi:response regulator, partial [Hydrogenophaga sp.]
MKLLLAEDDAMLGASMEKGLEQAGFKVDWVRTGNHASTALKTQSYDVALLDIGLPQIDGLE